MHHRAFGRRIEELGVVVVEDSRPMQTILRSILTACGVERLRVFDDAERALKDMLVDPPHLLLADWRMAAMSGLRLIHAMRHEDLAPLCSTAAILVTGHATRDLVAHAGRIGVHQVIVKPISLTFLQKRLASLVLDERSFALRGKHYVIDGMDAVLEERLERAQLYARKRSAELEAGAEALAPETPASETIGAAGAILPSPEPAPIIVPGERAGRRVRAEIDSSVWGGRDAAPARSAHGERRDGQRRHGAA